MKNKARKRSLKQSTGALIIGGGIGGLLGGAMVYSAGMSSEGILIGSFLGWLIGEIIGLAAMQGDRE